MMADEMDERTPKGALRRAMDLSGRSDAELSKALGKNQRYLSNLMNSKSSPSIDLYARILDECGMMLVARGDSGEMRIVPLPDDH